MAFFQRFIFLALLFWSVAGVGAQSIQDVKTGFSVELDFPKTSSCIVYPNQPYDADACPIDNYLFPTEDATMIARGVIKFEPGEMLFNMAQLKAPFTAPMSQNEAELFIERYLELFNASETQTLDSGMVVVNGQPFYRYYGDVGSDTALPYSRILFYAFSGKGYHFFVSFNFDVTQEKKAFEISDYILRGIKVPLPEHTEKGELLYQLSYEVFFSVSLFVTLFVFFSAWAWLFGRFFPKTGKKSMFRGSGFFALEGFTRFAVLSILIVGIYELSVVFRKREVVETFLMIYLASLGLFFLIRGIGRWFCSKWCQPDRKSLENHEKRALFFPVGVPKFIILSVFTFGLYSFYWFYKNWSYIQQETDERIYPVIKAVFYPICAYFLFKRIRSYVEKAGLSLRIYPRALAFVLILCFLVDMVPLGNVVPESFLAGLGLMMFILEFVILLPVIYVVNQLNLRLLPEADFNRRFTWVDVVVCLIGGFILSGIVYLLYASWSGVI